MKMNPYRKGVAAGYADGEAFKAWREECNRKRDWSTPRPERPKCPYIINVSVRQWQNGFRQGLRQAGVLQ